MEYKFRHNMQLEDLGQSLRTQRREQEPLERRRKVVERTIGRREEGHCRVAPELIVTDITPVQCIVETCALQSAGLKTDG